MITLSVNGQARQLNVPDEMPLLWVLRDELDLKGTKFLKCVIILDSPNRGYQCSRDASLK